jgi:hypothetical protein
LRGIASQTAENISGLKAVDRSGTDASAISISDKKTKKAC